jgi:hypothetical protein
MLYEIRYSYAAVEQLKNGRIDMNIHPVSDPKTPIGEIIKFAGSQGLVLETEDQERYALLPLDEDVIDLLIERIPKFRADCLEIRQRMDSGQFMTHEEVKRQLHNE